MAVRYENKIAWQHTNQGCGEGQELKASLQSLRWSQKVTVRIKGEKPIFGTRSKHRMIASGSTYVLVLYCTITRVLYSVLMTHRSPHPVYGLNEEERVLKQESYSRSGFVSPTFIYSSLVIASVVWAVDGTTMSAWVRQQLTCRNRSYCLLFTYASRAPHVKSDPT